MPEDVKSEKVNISTINRLLSMPAIIDINMLMREGMSRETAKNWAQRAADRQMIDPAGPRLGVYYNLIKDRAGRKKYLGELLIREFSTPVVIGATAINAHGWTTQMPRQLEVAVPVTHNRRRSPQVYGAFIVPRSLLWYKRVAGHVTNTGLYGLPLLDPEYALADCYRYRDTWVPDPDDIDISDATSEHVSGLVAALEEMKVEEEARDNLVDEIDPEAYGFKI